MPDPNRLASPQLQLRVYRWLLKLYPAAFREEYAAPMEREFCDELKETGNSYAVTLLWIRLVADLAVSVPRQLIREISQDLKHTFRLWAKNPWHIGFAIVALAVGIGANTGVFSVINALLLRSLPFREPSRLASSRSYVVPHDSAKQFHDWHRQSKYLEDAALVEQIDLNLGNEQKIVRAHIAQTSWNFFPLLGAQPVLGRAFSSGEDEPAHDAVAVIGYGLWQQLFAGNRQALGSTIRVDGKPLTIVGVASPGFEYPGKTVLWKAAQFSPGNNDWETIARLKPSISWTQARAAFTADMDRISPDSREVNTSKHVARLIPLQDELAGPVKKASLLLMASVALILLIACTNVASLLLARTVDRAAELSVRSALGASKARLVQQLLTECLFLSSIAALVGLIVAYWASTIAAKVQPAPLASQSYSILDGHVLVFAIVVSTLSGVLCAILPSLAVGRLHSFEARGASSTKSLRLTRETLVAAQVMLTLILLTGAISVGRAFVKLMQIDRGFDVQGLITVSVSLEGTTHKLDKRQLLYFEEALSRVRRLPGVRSASLTEFLPLDATGFVGGRLGLDGRPAKQSSMIVPVLSDYFKTMGGRILHGREIADAEIRSNTKVAVVNEVYARQFGAPLEALGHRVTSGKEPPWKIVGVVRRTDYMTEGANQSQIFVPAHSSDGFSSTFVVRVNGRAEDHIAVIRDAIQFVDTHVPVFGAKTMEQRMNEALARPKFYRTTLLFFAGFAVLLAVIGIYGIVSYAVAQRSREMGVRLALGTTPSRLRSMLLLQGLLTVTAGATVGSFGAMLFGRFLVNLVEGTASIDAGTLAYSILSFCLIAATSIWAATRRISKLDVMAVLRLD